MYHNYDTSRERVSLVFFFLLVIVLCLSSFCTGCVSEPTRVAAIKLEKQLKTLRRASVPHPSYAGKPEQLSAYEEAWDEALATDNTIIEANGGRE